MNVDQLTEGAGQAVARSASDVSAIIDLKGQRAGRAHKALPNGNLIVARTLVPQLRGEIASGETILVTAAMALPAGPEAEAAFANRPVAPDVAELVALFAAQGVDVSAILVPERF
jgi:hypothetical protein